MPKTLFPEFDLPLNEEQSFLDLCELIESPTLAGQYYIAANTAHWLYTWLGKQLPIKALQERVLKDTEWRSSLLKRTQELFWSQYVKGQRIQHEAALCCYVYVLTHIQDPDVRNLIKDMEENVNQQHGWLKVVLSMSLRNRSINENELELYLMPKLTLELAPTVSSFNIVNSSGLPFMASASTYKVVSEKFSFETAA